MSWRKPGKGGSGGGGYNLSQKTNLGVVGSVGTPHVEDVVIPNTTDFKRIHPEVLKFVGGGTQIVTECAFDNADGSSFTADAQVVFDGTMHLRTSYASAMTDEGVLGSGSLFSTTIDRTQFKMIEGIAIS